MQAQREAVAVSVFPGGADTVPEGLFADLAHHIGGMRGGFGLRGFIACGDCGGPLSACWSKGKAKRPSYYLCPKVGCPSYRKSIRRADVEGEFEGLLQKLQPSPGLFKLTRAMFEDAWEQRAAHTASLVAAATKQVREIDKQIDGLVNRILEATSPRVITAYQKRVSALEAERLAAQERVASIAPSRDTFEQKFELAMGFLSSPWNIWVNGSLRLRRTVLRSAFTERLVYCRKSGLRTPALSIPFCAISDRWGDSLETDSSMARPAGLEPATVRLEGGCSIRLSYGRLSASAYPL